MHKHSVSVTKKTHFGIPGAERLTIWQRWVLRFLSAENVMMHTATWRIASPSCLEPLGGVAWGIKSHPSPWGLGLHGSCFCYLLSAHLTFPPLPSHSALLSVTWAFWSLPFPRAFAHTIPSLSYTIPYSLPDQCSFILCLPCSPPNASLLKLCLA